MPFVTLPREQQTQENLPYVEIFRTAVENGNSEMALDAVRYSLGDYYDSAIFHVTQVAEGSSIVDRYKQAVLSVILESKNPNETFARNIETLLSLEDYNARKMNFPPSSKSVVEGAFVNVRQNIRKFSIDGEGRVVSNLGVETVKLLQNVSTLLSNNDRVDGIAKALKICRDNSAISWEISELRLVYLSIERYLLGVQNRIAKQTMPSSRIESIFTGGGV